MAATVKGLRSYLRLVPEDDEELKLYLNAAKAKAKAAGVPDFKANAQYDLFIYALAAMYHDNRGMAFASAQAAAEETAKRMIDAFVLELRYSDTEGGGGA